MIILIANPLLLLLIKIRRKRYDYTTANPLLLLLIKIRRKRYDYTTANPLFNSAYID